MQTLWQDVRVALRMLRRAPFVTIPAVVVLTLGIGMATAIYALVYATWLHPLPYPAADRLVSVATHYPSYKLDVLLSSDYGEWQGTRSFGPLAAYNLGKSALIAADETVEIGRAQVSGNLLSVLRVRAALGRGIEPGDEGAGAPHVAVLCDGFWRERFGGERSVLGSSVNLEGESYTIVGVLPPGFRMPEQTRADVVTPLAIDRAFLRHGAGSAKVLRGLARLQPGATLATASAELSLRLGASRAAEPVLYPGNVSIRLMPLVEYAGGNVRVAGMVLVGAVAGILLIACANVSSLLMARAAGRQREIAVRRALGASPLRIVRHLLLEGLALGAAGIAGGLLLAAALTRLVQWLRPAMLVRAGAVSVNGEVLAAVIPVVLLCSLASSLAAALPLPRLRMRRALVVMELAVSLSLLAGAALMLQSLARLRAVSPGFRTDGVVTASIAVGDRSTELRRDLRERLERVPGVIAVSFAHALPPNESSRISAFSRADRPMPDAARQQDTVLVRLVDERFFQTLGIPLLKGRLFSREDIDGNAAVAVVNRTFARRYFVGEQVLGKQVDGMLWKTVVGVAADIRNDGLRNPPRPEIDVPFTERFRKEGGGVTSGNGLKVLIRSSGDATLVARELLRSLHEIDPQLVASTSTSTIAEQWHDLGAALEFEATVFTAFAGLALVMASAGIYGVLSHVVVLRRREIGVRMALGANPASVQALVVHEALWLATAGMVLGLGGTLAASRLLQRLAYEIKPEDPLTLAIASAVLLLVAVCASAAPARRASRQNPADILRAE